MVFAKKKVPGFAKKKTEEVKEEPVEANEDEESSVENKEQPQPKQQGLTRDEVKDVIIGNLIRVIELVKVL